MSKRQEKLPIDRVGAILAEAKKFAREYRELTGKPLGITGEVAEYEAARLLGLELTPARTAGHDAIRPIDGRRFQIKGRCVVAGASRSQRISRIARAGDFDSVLLVLLDQDFDAFEIYEANRDPVIDALSKPGSRSRNERGSLGVSQFIRIARLVWSREGEARAHSGHRASVAKRVGVAERKAPAKPVKYVKVEIQFWWDESDGAIHVTTNPGSTKRDLHTTFPNNQVSVRWHRSFFKWLADTLSAEGKPTPQAPVLDTADSGSPISAKDHRDL